MTSLRFALGCVALVGCNVNVQGTSSAAGGGGAAATGGARSSGGTTGSETGGSAGRGGEGTGGAATGGAASGGAASGGAGAGGTSTGGTSTGGAGGSGGTPTGGTGGEPGEWSVVDRHDRAGRITDFAIAGNTFYVAAVREQGGSMGPPTCTDSVDRLQGESWAELLSQKGHCADVPALAISATGSVYVTMGPGGIQKHEGESWSNVGMLSGYGRKPIVLDSNQVPYVLACETASVASFDGDDWQTLGDANAGWSSFSDLALHPDNTPYVVYGDAGSFEWQSQSYALSVSHYAKSAWQGVGDAEFARSSTNAADIAISKSGEIYVAFIAADRDSVVVMTSSGGEWTPVGAPLSVAGAVASGDQHAGKALPSLALSPDGVPHVVYVADAGNGLRSFVARFSGGEWQSLTPEGFASGDFHDAELVITADGTPYVAFIDEFIDDNEQNGSEIVIMKYASL